MTEEITNEIETFNLRAMEIKIYKTFMGGVKIHCNGELVASVPYTNNGVKFIEEISNLTSTTVVDNVRNGDMPESIESSLHLHSVIVSVCECGKDHSSYELAVGTCGYCLKKIKEQTEL